MHEELNHDIEIRYSLIGLLAFFIVIDGNFLTHFHSTAGQSDEGRQSGVHLSANKKGHGEREIDECESLSGMPSEQLAG